MWDSIRAALLDPHHRSGIIALLSLVLVFFHPVGWAFIYLLWLVNLCLFFREAQSRAMRVVFGALALLAALLVLGSLAALWGALPF